MKKITIVQYQPGDQVYFERFNRAWLEEFFTVEPIDKRVLEDPEETILNTGGKILFASMDGEIIGTVALKKVEDQRHTSFELTKMAVDKKHQGLGAGKILCQAAIDTAKELGASSIILYSQTDLTAAINIYRKFGFIEIPMEKGKYARADIKMELEIVSH